MTFDVSVNFFFFFHISLEAFFAAVCNLYADYIFKNKNFVFTFHNLRNKGTLSLFTYKTLHTTYRYTEKKKRKLKLKLK